MAAGRDRPRNLGDVDLEWRIDLARKGDGKLLAQLLLRKNAEGLYEPIPRKLRAFLVKVVSGKIILNPPLPRTRTFIYMSRRWLREKAVARIVDIEMRDQGKSRAADLRTALIRKWSKYYGTDEAAVRRYLKHKPKPLTAGARAERAAGIAAAKLRKSAKK